MPTISNPKFLIVDGSKAYARMLGRILEDRCQAQMYYSASRNDLLDLVSALYPDVIIFDIYALTRSFAAFIKEIRDRSSSTKIIVMSFEVYEEVAEAFLDAGVVGFFDKSVYDEVLLASSVQKVLAGEVVILNSHGVLI